MNKFIESLPVSWGSAYIDNARTWLPKIRAYCGNPSMPEYEERLSEALLAIEKGGGDGSKNAVFIAGVQRMYEYQQYEVPINDFDWHSWFFQRSDLWCELAGRLQGPLDSLVADLNIVSLADRAAA